MTRLRPLLLTLSLLLVVAVSALGGAASAQPANPTPNYTDWDNVATFTERAIEAKRASNTALEELRNEIVNWRQQFLDAQQTNRAAIATVRAQLDAIGPAPEDGSEAEDIASQRQELNSRLSQLQAPVKRAELAYTRADSMVSGIDGIIRERQTEELLDFGPSPLNPAHWVAGAQGLYAAFDIIRNEVVGAWNDPEQRAETKEDLPGFLVLTAIGVILIARGRRWTKRLVRYVLCEDDDRVPGAGRWVAAYVVSLGALVLPLLGTFALVEAAYVTGLVGVRGTLFLSALLRAVFIYLLARWLSMRIFPSIQLRSPLASLNDQQRRSGRFYGASLGVVISTFYLLHAMSEYAEWSEAATNVVLFPVMVIASLLLIRVARLLMAHARSSAEEGAGESYRGRLLRLASQAVIVLSILAPVLAAIGYFKAAQSLMQPSLFSLMLVAVLVVLQRLVNEVYAFVSGRSDGISDSLIPVLIGFALVLLSAPIFALIWGARVADLTELWTQFTEGVDLGGVRISPTIFLTLAIVFAIGYVLTRMLQGTLKNTILPKTKLDTGGRNAITAGVGYIGIFLSALIAITSAGIDLSSLAIVAGALSVGIGFGLQNIVSNFVSGIILLIERPISEGDWIEVGGTHGYVRDISVRSTTIETFDRSDVIVPNADLVSGTVTNYTRGNTVGRVIVPVGVAYGSDTRQVEQILKDVAEAHPMVLANPPPAIIFRGFGADSLDFEIRAILRDVNWVMSVHSDMNHEIAQKFADSSIEIPFAQRDVWLRNPETLAAARPEEAAAPAKSARKRTRRVKDTNDETGDGEAEAD
ncbi:MULTISPECIES: DUF3772 domain-containing protein [unclassified Roseovarius]|uniref:DUF3772 domain-containing protein n=1 Tax=unclassified Roseovarius TaxID=2614913 RepID=UPI00273FB8C1|nr:MULTISPECIES: DUF3772 domain-containing protein [unclassified Roseovarius]